MLWNGINPGSVPEEQHLQESTEMALRRKRIHIALSQLSPNEKQALIMAYFGFYTQGQIVEALKQPLETIKNCIRLGMEKLRYLLREETEADKSIEVFLDTIFLTKKHKKSRYRMKQIAGLYCLGVTMLLLLAQTVRIPKGPPGIIEE